VSGIPAQPIWEREQIRGEPAMRIGIDENQIGFGISRIRARAEAGLVTDVEFLRARKLDVSWLRHDPTEEDEPLDYDSVFSRGENKGKPCYPLLKWAKLYGMTNVCDLNELPQVLHLGLSGGNLGKADVIDLERTNLRLAKRYKGNLKRVRHVMELVDAASDLGLELNVINFSNSLSPVHSFVALRDPIFAAVSARFCRKARRAALACWLLGTDRLSGMWAASTPWGHNMWDAFSYSLFSALGILSGERVEDLTDTKQTEAVLDYESRKYEDITAEYRAAQLASKAAKLDKREHLRKQRLAKERGGQSGMFD